MRRKQNTILWLKDKGGVWRNDELQLQEILMSYFKGIFSSRGPSSDALEAALNTVHPKVTPEMNEQLVQPFTAAEVRIALFSMSPFKSPDPNGGYETDGVGRNSDQSGSPSDIPFVVRRLHYHLRKSYRGGNADTFSVLDTYATASGQQINLEKSSIVISRNINEEQQRRLAALLGLQVTFKHEKISWFISCSGKVTK
ncbi:UNVERIFIED_CONTAM: hypothetical protein Sradi_3665600 [Sesamum radiatum]|uniref:Uncharacterized protein n=1 Tax=Sesamum radiatum TaxID=300843 RepID=A0AAW2QJ33_SESRA